MLMSGHVIGHVIRLLIDSGRGLSNGCVCLLQWLDWWCIQILKCTTDSYPHDGRADKDSYPHDGRADKDSYPHDRHNQYIMLSL